jgi:hypothetical protein
VTGNGDNYDYEYTDECDVTPSRPNNPEDLIRITTSVPMKSITQNVDLPKGTESNVPEASNASQPETTSSDKKP